MRQSWAKTVTAPAPAPSHTGNWGKEAPAAALIEPTPPQITAPPSPSDPLVEKPGEYQACFSMIGVPGPVFYDGNGDAFIAPSWVMKLPGLAPASGKMVMLAWSSMRVVLHGRNLDKLIEAVQFHKGAKFRTYNPKLYPLRQPNADGPDYEAIIDRMEFTDGDGNPLEQAPRFG